MMTACFPLTWLTCQMMTLLNPGILSWHLHQIMTIDCMLSSDVAVMPNDDLTESRDSVMALTPDNDCMLSSDVAVMPNDDLTESRDSVMALTPDNDYMLSSDVAVMPNDDLTESSVSVCHGSYTRWWLHAFLWHGWHAKWWPYWIQGFYHGTYTR